MSWHLELDDPILVPAEAGMTTGTPITEATLPPARDGGTAPSESLRPVARPTAAPSESLRPVARPDVGNDTVADIGNVYRQGDRDAGPNGDIRAAQTALTRLGTSVGEVDGVYGRNTSNAVQDAQEMFGLPRTGVLDQDTQDALNNLTDDQIAFFTSETEAMATPITEPETPTGDGQMSPLLDSKGETVPIPTWQKTLGKPIFNNGSFSQNNLSEAISSSGIDTEESAILRGAFETEVGDRGPVTETGYSRRNVINMGPNSTWGRRMVRDGVMNADGTLTNLYSGDNVFNSVYANRNGNGDFASGDGARYKGRGLIQITGRDNYQEVQNRLSDLGLEVDIMSNPDLVNEEKYALPAALALLDHLGVNESTIPTMSAKGLNNAINSNAPVATAEERWENVVDIITEDEEQELATAVSNRNEYAAQRTVGTSVDGNIGPNSVRAMRSWLTRNNVAIPEDATNLDLVILVNENS